ncbi:ornithine cyclodeaminase family protein [Halorhabdus sp. CUG00001]|uniref:ornithine cyclodeaminase family protein n=1 Tax=Halorhabdus sp. CUG00001 TaxID=2600297 RepID=UPI00131AAD4B|nr:ornithine cyclodeaminase family protein [Halorhabdus sp. CUG00001]
METVLLGPEAVKSVIEIGDVVDAVEAAFVAEARGNAQMPAKSYVDLPQYGGDFRSMPAYLDTGEFEGAAVKWVNVHPDNPADHDLPTVMGTIVYTDPETGFPLAILDGTTITRLRTGAAAAVATKYLAREDASSLGLVGAGQQAYTQLAAIATVRDIETVIVADTDRAAVEAFLDRFGDRFDVREGTIDEAAACDVVSTITPVRDPIVMAVGERTHVNAMGADAAGKHEIADAVLEDARLVIDDYEQCVHSGELNVPYSEGVLTDDDIGAELGAVVAGEVPGRTEATGVTVFDSTGLAIQDVAASHVAYESAQAAGLGEDYRLVDTTS